MRREWNSMPYTCGDACVIWDNNVKVYEEVFCTRGTRSLPTW